MYKMTCSFGCMNHFESMEHYTYMILFFVCKFIKLLHDKLCTSTSSPRFCKGKKKRLNGNGGTWAWLKIWFVREILSQRWIVVCPTLISKLLFWLNLPSAVDCCLSNSDQQTSILIIAYLAFDIWWESFWYLAFPDLMGDHSCILCITWQIY